MHPNCRITTATVTAYVESPDGKYNAYIFVRDLGATTKASNQLSILRKGDKLGNISGNIFVTYGDFNVSWSSPTELNIKVTKVGEVFKKIEEYKGIKINYFE